jgi:hypothetical protein
MDWTTEGVATQLLTGRPFEREKIVPTGEPESFQTEDGKTYFEDGYLTTVLAGRIATRKKGAVTVHVSRCELWEPEQ